MRFEIDQMTSEQTRIAYQFAVSGRFAPGQAELSFGVGGKNK